MDETQKKMSEEEQKRYIASFAEALRAIEAEYKKQGRYGKAYLELKRKGMWVAEYIAPAYILVVGKLSPLSKRLRDYILAVGELAHQIYDKSTEIENSKDEK
jgi:hypothetical protein